MLKRPKFPVPILASYDIRCFSSEHVGRTAVSDSNATPRRAAVLPVNNVSQLLALSSSEPAREIFVAIPGPKSQRISGVEWIVACVRVWLARLSDRWINAQELTRRRVVIAVESDSRRTVKRSSRSADRLKGLRGGLRRLRRPRSAVHGRGDDTSCGASTATVDNRHLRTRLRIRWSSCSHRTRYPMQVTGVRTQVAHVGTTVRQCH